MREGSAVFVLEGAAGAIEDQLQVCIGKSLHLAARGRAYRRRRTWLDTFDWRLYRAGLALEQVGTGTAAELVLTGPDGAQLAASPIPGRQDGPAISWPSPVSRLPPGRLRDLLGPVAGIRALAPVARAVSQIGSYGVLNSDTKTVAWITVDRMCVTLPERAQLLPRVSVTAVRGYEARAGRIVAALRAGDGNTGQAPRALDAVLVTAGVRPTAGQPEPALDAAMPAQQAVARILIGLLDCALANVPGTIRDTDTEFLHDLRVAVRRTRSVLKLAGDVLPAGLAATFAPEFRWLGELTTPTRDLDVYLLGYPRMSASLQAATADELVPFHQYLVGARTQERQKLVRGLRSVRFTRLVREWKVALAELVAEGGLPPGEAEGGPGGLPPGEASPTLPTSGRLAARKIDLARRKALQAGRRVVPGCPADNLHDLRKRCKELRYLVEMFGPLYDPAQRAAAVRELKALQDCLGEFQDAEVQRAEIRVFAEAMLAQPNVHAPTILALGEVSAGLAVRQRQARAEFDARFAAFARPGSQARLKALSSSGAQSAPAWAAA